MGTEWTVCRVLPDQGAWKITMNQQTVTKFLRKADAVQRAREIAEAPLNRPSRLIIYDDQGHVQITTTFPT